MPTLLLSDFIYATFVEVLCPICGELALCESKNDARHWAKEHRADNH